jgi:hypothetical protein
MSSPSVGPSARLDEVPEHGEARLRIVFGTFASHEIQIGAALRAEPAAALVTQGAGLEREQR